MALLPQCTRQIVRATTGFHANQQLLPVRGVEEQLFPRELPAYYAFAACVQAYDVEGGLAQINTECCDLHGDPPAKQDSPTVEQAADHSSSGNPAAFAGFPSEVGKSKGLFHGASYP